MKRVSALPVALAALALPSVPASAAVLIGAKTITISSAINDYLQVGEFVATQAGTGTDVAATINGGTASALDSWQANHDSFASGHADGTTQQSANYAIDGVNIAGYPDIYHSATASSSNILTINLAAATNLSSWTIFGRIIDGETFAPDEINYVDTRDIYTVSIFDTNSVLLWSGTMNAYGNVLAHEAQTGVYDTSYDFATAAVPEPMSWLMMLAGFGAIGFVLRRRNETVRVAYA